MLTTCSVVELYDLEGAVDIVIMALQLQNPHTKSVLSYILAYT
jgi:hypothetical protein